MKRVKNLMWLCHYVLGLSSSDSAAFYSMLIRDLYNQNPIDFDFMLPVRRIFGYDIPKGCYLHFRHECDHLLCEDGDVIDSWHKLTITVNDYNGPKANEIEDEYVFTVFMSDVENGLEYDYRFFEECCDWVKTIKLCPNKKMARNMIPKANGCFDMMNNAMDIDFFEMFDEKNFMTWEEIEKEEKYIEVKSLLNNDNDESGYDTQFTINTVMNNLGNGGHFIEHKSGEYEIDKKVDYHGELVRFCAVIVFEKDQMVITDIMFRKEIRMKGACYIDFILAANGLGYSD